MQINNPLQMNDWEIKKFLKVVLSIQLAMWGAIGFDAAGLQIPIIRQIIGIIYLTFIPGIIILRVLKLHKLGDIETLLYMVGLSIATLMFTGLFVNTVYPFFGFYRPISTVALIITISIVVLILCVLCYIRDKSYSTPSFIDIKDLLSPPALFLFLIPFSAVFGTYLVNFHQNNILLMLMIAVISMLVLLIGFDKFIPKKFYPLAIFVISISLLFHNSLISTYIWGWDIHLEYYLSNLIVANAYWDSTNASIVNGMLSIVTLAPIFYDISGMSLIWIFKIIYPFLFALVPLGLYRVFQKQTNDKIAFLACIFFVSVNTFYTEMLSLARQEIAELFLVLLILSMIDKDMAKIKRSFLLIVFGVSLVVSHYGLSYIYMTVLISAWLLLVSYENPGIQKLVNGFYFKFNRNEDAESAGIPILLKKEGIAISPTFILLFVVFAISWYMYVSNSSSFNAIVSVGNHIVSSIYTDFLNPEAAQGLKIMMTETYTPLHNISKIINYLNQIFIIIGIFLLLKKREKFEKEYVAFSAVDLTILFASISIPFFASSLNMTRVYQITLLILAPFSVIGALAVFMKIGKKVGILSTDKNVRRSLQVLSVYFVIFFLYQTGFIYQIAEGYSGSISLSQEGIKNYPKAQTKMNFYNTYIPEQDVFSAKWLSNNRNGIYKIYSDDSLTGLTNNALVSAGLIDLTKISTLTNTTSDIPLNSYIYLRYVNIKEGIMSYRIPGTLLKKGGVYNTTEIYPLIETKNKIYSNGGSNIYARDY
jgi:uncharacterized membrane protein